MERGYRTNSVGPAFRGRAQKGFSLIEALVVLVVLVIGIFAVLRLFPGGFLTIQRTGEMTIGQSLSTRQLAVENEQLNVPESIVAAYPDANNNLIVDASALPDDLTDYTATSLPANIPPGIDPYFVSNVNRIRYVVGESFRIPASSPNIGGGWGSTYILRYGPVFNQFGSNLNDANNPPDSISVYGASMDRSEQSSVPAPGSPVSMNGGIPSVSGDGQYAIDYDNLRIAFAPRILDTNSSRPPMRVFKITYDYYVAGNPVSVQSVVSGPATTIVVPDVAAPAAGASLDPVWVPIFSGTNDTIPAGYTPAQKPVGFLGLKRNSEDVSRKYRLVSLESARTWTASPWSDDPYEYGWNTPNEPDANGKANVGVLIFNPIGYSERVSNSRGVQPNSARVDYSIFDNHIIREDKSVPAQAPFMVRLATPFLLTSGDIMNDDTPYNGIFRSDTQNTPDILIYNANTGLEVARQTADNNGIPVKTGAIFDLDKRTGQVFFRDGTLAGRNLRIYYRTQKEWGMQLQKSNSHYVQANTPAEMTYRSYYVGGTQPGVGSPSRIYFMPCECGKTVVLGEYWRVGDTTPLRNEARQISAPNLRDQLSGQTLALPYIDIGKPLTGDRTGRAVDNVRGASIKSRVIWRDSGRWRKIDADSFGSAH